MGKEYVIAWQKAAYLPMVFLSNEDFLDLQNLLYLTFTYILKGLLIPQNDMQGKFRLEMCCYFEQELLSW